MKKYIYTTQISCSERNVQVDSWGNFSEQITKRYNKDVDALTELLSDDDSDLFASANEGITFISM